MNDARQRSTTRNPSRTPRTSRQSVWPPVLLVLMVAAACGSPTPQPPPPPPPPDPAAISLVVDTTVTPSGEALPGFADGAPRPLAAVTGDDGLVAEFVADELWLSGPDPAELAAVLARYGGAVLAVFRPGDHGLSGLPDQYLVRVDASGADEATLAADLRALEPTAAGEHRVSSQRGLDLLVIASREAASGTDVGLNWVGSGAQFRDRETSEAPTGTGSAGGPYVADAFRWPSHARGGAQDIGVAEAWRALELAGRLDSRVKLAILDMGFAPDADTPSDWTAVSNVPFVSATGTANALRCGGGHECPWHGTNVLSAAMAVPDNGYGAAGPAGPIAAPVMVYTLYDFFTSITALGEARLRGARIANLSYGAPVPWYLGWSVLPFEAATAAFRGTGMLLFAAAGNEGRDVDARDCTLGKCWERTWFTPCENAGVICVGGMAAGSTTRAAQSNYGAEQVDLFGPFTLWVGPDPAAPTNRAQAVSGTSVASPFVAGVAALVWAANPGLGADAVENALLSTAHPNGDGTVRRHVNALAAVQLALGNVPPAVTLAAVGDVPYNLTAFLSATVEDFEDPFPCCTVTWSSDVDGPLGSG
jgi:serine protease